MHGVRVVRLGDDARANATQLLHVRADAEEETDVDAEGTDVGTGLALDPEDAELALVVVLDDLALVDGADAEAALDGRDGRGALEQAAGQLLHHLREK